MTALTGGDLVAESLVVGGVTHTFGGPGEQWLGILDAIGRREELRFVSTRHEGGAANMAEAHGKLTGRPAAVLGTAGVGAAHLAAGVHTAAQDSTPLVAVIGQVRTGFRGREAWQELDVAAVFDTVAKHTVEIREVERIPELTQRAIDIAVAGRPGPVVIAVPENLQTAPCPAWVRDPSTLTRPGLAANVVQDIAARVGRAERPVIVVGGGVRAAGACGELVRFVDKTGLPVVLGWRRSDAFPNDHAAYAGQLGLGTLPAAAETVAAADLLVVVGTRLPQVTTGGYAFPRADQQVVHIDIAHESLVNQPLPAGTAVIADARTALADLTDGAQVRLGDEARAWVRDRVTEYRRQLGADAVTRRSDPGAATLVDVARRLDELLPDDAVVTCDAGDFSGPFAVHLQLREDRRFLGPTSGCMGYGLPAAVGAKSTLPDRAVVALCGDGGLMMAVQELETAVRYGLPVVVVVCNNNLHGSIARHQRARFGGRLVGTRLGNPAFPDLARAFGADGRAVSDADGFADAWKVALDSEVPSVIEVRM